MNAMLLEAGLILFIVALVSEYMDSTLGMGYGTTLTPVLIVMGFDPLQIVPAVLLSQMVAGFIAAGMHHAVGNVDFSRDSQHLHVALLLGAMSLIGAVAAVMIAVAIPPFYLKLYIGLLVITMGFIIFHKKMGNPSFSWAKIMGVGMLASFNKGISGGGYGPLVVTGQMFSGVDGKNAIAITALSEGMASFAAVTMYFILVPDVSLSIAPFILGGSLAAVPLSAHTLKRIKDVSLSTIVGAMTMLLGLLTLLQLFTSFSL